jgi:PhzF family phenazine biosynthesis protein
MSLPGLPLTIVDAFTDAPFRGNPAAVCPLDAWPDDARLQMIAAEHNLSETAFLVGGNGAYELRWFTPTLEVDLCGHATLASAHVVFSELEPDRSDVAFMTKSGRLTVRRAAQGRLALDFPSRPPVACAIPDGLAAALGADPEACLESRDLLAVFPTADAVRRLAPDMRAVAAVHPSAVIVTAPGDAPGVDFVSRFFAPAKGVDEDPVTGSAHCTLAPYWAERLGKGALEARQISRRGGAVSCRLDGERVILAGHAVTYARGTIFV